LGLYFSFSSQNLSQRGVLETTFQSIEAKFVAESRSRNHISVHRSRICRRERFSRPHFSPSKQNMSQRAVLEATFQFIVAEFVAESSSRYHISVFYRKICRREWFSRPHFSPSKQNLSQRAVLETTFQSIEAEFVAESRSRDHISVHRSKICRRERFSKPLFSSSKQNLSQRAVLGTTFQSIEEKYVAESGSRDHISVCRSKICRRERFSRPHFSQSKQNMSQRAVLETTFQSIEAKYVAESGSRDHISDHRSRICRRERFSRPHFSLS
jgi:hypothetical protein